MAQIVKKGTASPVSGNAVILNGPTLDTLSPPTTSYMPPMIAGEPIGQYDACHVSLVDGRVYKSYGGGAANYVTGPVGLDPVGYTDASLARCFGFAAEQVFNAGDPVTLVVGVVADYCNVAQACGTPLYISGTVAGGLADATSTNGTTVVAVVMGESPVATTSTKILTRHSF